MIAILAPSKGVNFKDPAPTDIHTQPEFLEESELLVSILKKFDKAGLMSLMAVSESIAEVNYERFQQFERPFTLENAKQALFSFTGDVYRHIRMNTYDESQLQFAQKSLRILSGLYGSLRPLDLIHPYRLEMQTRLKTNQGEDLYQFWGSKIRDALSRDLANDPSPLLLNLASLEYSKAAQLKKLEAPVLTMSFKEVDNGKARTIAIFAKWARGMMMDHIIQNKITDPDALKLFNEADYKYSAGDSTDTDWVFTRPRPE